MNRIMIQAGAGVVLGLVALGGCSSDTSKLEVGDCVHVEAGSFTLGGDTKKVSCDDVTLLSDNYQVQGTGSEAEMDQSCPAGGLVIVDGDDAACLTQ